MRLHPAPSYRDQARPSQTGAGPSNRTMTVQQTAINQNSLQLFRPQNNLPTKSLPLSAAPSVAGVLADAAVDLYDYEPPGNYAEYEYYKGLELGLYFISNYC